MSICLPTGRGVEAGNLEVRPESSLAVTAVGFYQPYTSVDSFFASNYLRKAVWRFSGFPGRQHGIPP